MHDGDRPARGPRARPQRGLGLALAFALLGSLPAAALEVEGVAFAERVTTGDGGAELRLHGAGLLRYRLVFRAYVAALYLPEDVAASAALASDVPRRLEISYFWAIDGEDFGRAADELLARQLDPAELLALRERIDLLHSAYRPVRPGERYSLTYTPGLGTELALDGEPLALIPGADFASAYFGIWLGEREPLDADLRTRLLGTGAE